MKRLLLLAVLIYALVFAALVSFNGHLLVLLIPLVLYMGAGLLFGPQQLQLQVRRTLSSNRVNEGTPIVVTLTVTNEGSHLEEVLIEDFPPPQLHVIDSDAVQPTDTHLLTSLAPGETAQLTYTVMGKRGLYTFEAIRVTAREHFNLFERQAVVQCPQATSVHILPRAGRLRRVAIRPRQTRVYAGSIPARIGGPGVTFFGVRTYQPSDPLRHINRRSLARHPESLYTNEFEQERIADVGLILDARRRTNIEGPGGMLFEYSVMAAASLAETFLETGNRVGLLTYGQWLDWTNPGYGKYQRERILRSLARAETGESQIFDKLEYLPTRFFPAKSQLVLVSPLCSDDPEFLIQLRGRGYELMIISPNPIIFERKELQDTSSVELATRIAKIERTLLFRKLRHAGVRVADWDVDKPFEQAVAASLARQLPWGRPRGIAI